MPRDLWLGFQKSLFEKLDEDKNRVDNWVELELEK